MQWVAIILVTAAIALNYMDRSTLAIGNLKIRQEFGISATAIGALGSAWALTYGIAQLPSGYLLDRIGPSIWSALQWSCGAMPGRRWDCQQLTSAECYHGSGSARRSAVLSLGDAFVSDWFDVKDRGTPSGVYTSGAYIGPTLGRRS